jgi:hypothetical protein
LITADADGVAGTELGVAGGASVGIFANAAALTGGSIGASTDAETVIYLTDVAQIYINDDGNTAGGLTLIADLGSALTLAVTDFQFIA